MRVRVLFGGASMRRPAGVADAVRAVNRVDADGVFQIAQFPGSAANRQMTISVQDRDSGRIVAAILQPAKPIEDNGHRLAIADIANNPTHRSSAYRTVACTRCMMVACGPHSVWRPRRQ